MLDEANEIIALSAWVFRFLLCLLLLHKISFAQWIFWNEDVKDVTEDAMGSNNVYKWYKTLNEERERVEDEQHSEQSPSSTDKKPRQRNRGLRAATISVRSIQTILKDAM